jgi:hypothetical protein
MSAGSSSSGNSAGGNSAGGNTAGGNSAGGNTAGGGSSGGASSTGITSTVVSLPTKGRGDVTLGQFTPDKATFSFYVNVQFSNDRGEWDGCTRNQLGSCWYYDCPAGSNGYGATTTALNEEAGTVSAVAMPGTLDLALGVSGLYEATANVQLFPLVAAAASVSVSVTGSTSVTAFTMQVPTPPAVSLVSINGEATPLSIVRSDGAKLVWTSTGPGTVYFVIFALMGERPAAFCEFDAAANAGEMPAAVLEPLDPTLNYRYELRGDMRSEINVGGWEIDSAAYSFGTSAALSSPIIDLD